MRFKTTTNAEYILSNIEENEFGFKAGFRRIEGDRPMRNVERGGTIDTTSDDEALIMFASMPTVGESFRYWHDEYFGCISTPVKETLE